ncbi:lysoplasmalogenase [Aeromicrobium sp. SMF47]|uniref:Lysoplasmalogenase n=1 Tax=Aeromicrobium yanjiei TaxID=2662028 RepID=A0A5Q2MCM6_9ACTN|nr:lysoplasmalogenase [Aeromicrobium yanjiei]MRJ75218.1 lysoplasmalogenase [Aeromicrobium yanjiei]QGG40318.1 lysoplasmalogenase [Aeromicrobium yanjiei]
MNAVKSPWLIAFGVVAVVHLVLNGVEATPWDSITKCLLAPLLVGWVLEQRGPRLLAVALVFCCLGDLFLEIEDMFTAGMAAFAVAHVCLITFFVRRGAIEQLRRKPLILVAYVVAAVALVAWCWGGLEPGLKPLVPVYAALLLATAATALSTDLRAGIGGALFLVSDGIIALAEAGRIDQDATVTGLAIMALYILAIFFLTTGIVWREKRTVAAGAGFDPTVRTDCWPRLPAAR